MKKSEELKALEQDLHDARMNLHAAEERLLAAQGAFDLFAESLDAGTAVGLPVNEAKRTGGRKPGSKNKPKADSLIPKSTPAQRQTEFNTAEFDKKETLASLFDRYECKKDERSHFVTSHPGKNESELIVLFKDIVGDYPVPA